LCDVYLFSYKYKIPCNPPRTKPCQKFILKSEKFIFVFIFVLVIFPKKSRVSFMVLWL
jgi:hypothetical protein